MKERERNIVTGLLLLMLILWLGFTLHRSPRFPGSGWGLIFGISGAVLMLVPLLYLFIKRIRGLKNIVTKHVSMRTLLAWHIYAGILGPILALVHTGHRFESVLGVALTANMIVVVISGFIGRYLMGQFSQSIRQKKETLTGLEVAYRDVAERLAREPEQIRLLRPFTGLKGQIVSGLFAREAVGHASLSLQAVELVDSIATIEYSISSHERVKQLFSSWLKLHIFISLVLYVLLGAHIWAELYFGLRWFS